MEHSGDTLGLSMERYLPGDLDFYGLGMVTRTSAARAITPRFAAIVRFVLGGDEAGSVLVGFAPGALDPSACVELANILASKLVSGACTAWDVQIELSPPEYRDREERVFNALDQALTAASAAASPRTVARFQFTMGGASVPVVLGYFPNRRGEA
jgi:hypothetical protein